MSASASSIRFRRSECSSIPDCFIADRGPDGPILVAVHGISRNAAEIAARFAGDPRFDGFTICAPLFERQRFGQYQQLIARKGRVPADLALIDLLSALRPDPTKAKVRISLFGFSGGAQMAHRFAMLHPERIDAVCAVAAGWYLMPDRDLAYPYGLADNVRFNGIDDAFLELPITVAVGTRDTRLDKSVRQNDTIDAIQGRSRVSRARSWVFAMQKRAAERGVQSKTRFVRLPKGVHDFGQCVREAGLLDVAANAFRAGIAAA